MKHPEQKGFVNLLADVADIESVDPGIELRFVLDRRFGNLRMSTSQDGSVVVFRCGTVLFKHYKALQGSWPQVVEVKYVG